ncbi:MAG: response regulator [Acidobacteriota bacterium]|nr:MAG: response regulator [Acidobacteriota bacterium]
MVDDSKFDGSIQFVSARNRALLIRLRQELIPQLNAILGYSEMLRDDAQSTRQLELSESLNRIRGAGKKLLTVINGHLGSSRMGTVRLDYDIEHLCRSLSAEMRPLIDEVITLSTSLIETLTLPEHEHYTADLKKIRLVGERLRNSMVMIAEIPGAEPTATVGKTEFSTFIGGLTMHDRLAMMPMQGGTVLVVDEDEINRDLLVRQLERDGHSVTAVSSGIEALQSLQSRNFDLVLLDLMMKGMNGLAVLDWVNADENIRDIPVIVLSPLDEIKSIVRCIEKGAEDYLTKPLNSILLRTRINACLEKKRLRDHEREMIEQLQDDREKQAELLQELATANWELAQTMDELKSAQEKLITQEKLASLGALTAGIAHEIKNPLNFVTNFAQLTGELTAELKDELSELLPQLDSERASYINDILDDLSQNSGKINEHGKRADSIVRSMLLLSRGQTGEWRKTDLNALISEYLNLAYHGLRASDPSFNLEILTRYDQSIEPIDAVAQDLGRVLLNIFNNACYAVGEKKKKLGDAYAPQLVVQTRGNGDQIGISILDNGPGIPKSIIDKVFHPFFTTKPPGEGTGLGLSIGHEIIVKQHRGELRVLTEEGQFTEFIITLPLRAA